MPANSDDATASDDSAAERTVVLARHLHARPAGQVSQLAARHQPATIELVSGDRTANVRSVLAVMALGAVRGDEVTVKVTGTGADALADQIVEILATPDDGE